VRAQVEFKMLDGDGNVLASGSREGVVNLRHGLDGEVTREVRARARASDW
jgi:hypothetical protein